MYTIISQELKLESVIPFAKVLNFSFEWKINEHPQALVKGIVDTTQLKISNSEKKGKLLSDEEIIALTNTDIKIIYGHETDKDDILFYGTIESIKQSVVGGIIYLDAIVASASKELDKCNYSYSYQDISMTHADIAKEIVERMSGKIICTIGKERQIEKPYIQYQETNWNFLQRIASHLHGYLVADVISGKPALWFGMRVGKQIQELNIANMNMSILKLYEKDTRNLQVINYSIQSTKNFALGDYIDVNGIPYFLSEKRAELSNGEVTFYYVFASKGSIGLKEIYNTKFTGLSLSATIEKTEKEFIYVSFDIDGNPGKYPYLWKPESGNALYCMPESGTTVDLYFPNADEREGFGVRCLNRTRKRDEKEDMPDNKAFDTPTKSQLNLSPKSLDINKSDVDDGKYSLTILDGQGVSMNSSKKIDFIAVGNIQINAPVIRITGQTEIKFES